MTQTANTRVSPLDRLPAPTTLWHRLSVVVLIAVTIYAVDALTYVLGDKWLFEELELDAVFWTSFSEGARLFSAGFLLYFAALFLPVAVQRGMRGSLWMLPLALSAALLGGTWLAQAFSVSLLAGTTITFDQPDPVFGRDLGFYVFSLPWFWTVWKAVAVALSLALVAAVASVPSARRGAIRDGQRTVSERVAPYCSPVVVAVIALLGLVLVVGQWLSRYSVLTDDNSDSSVYVGASYIDVSGLLSSVNSISVSALCIAAFVAILCTGLWRLHYARRQDQWRNPFVWLLLPLVIDFGFKGAVALRDVLFVEPNEPVIQLESIAHHIEATRRGAKLENISTVPYLPNAPGASLPPIETVLDNAAIRNLPLWPGFSSYLEQLLDPQHAKRVLLPGGSNLTYGPSLETMQQSQKLRTYYRMMGVDFARYEQDGEQRMVVSAVRELPLYEPVPWLGYFGQRYMLYTHGFGMVMAPANEVSDIGGMNYVAKDIPGIYDWPAASLDNERVYYGEGAATMAFSNVDRMEELDFPTDTDRAVIRLADGETTAVKNDSLLKRLVFGWRSGHLVEFLFSSLITDETSVHYFRRPIERLQRVAPFLYYDSNAYAVAAEGRVQWMINGLATSDRFPYARYAELGDKSDQRSPYPLEHRLVNYVEDAVKAVVDGYSGSVSFYKVGDEPVINAWEEIFPSLFRDIEEMPPSLLSQVTYSPQLFHFQFDDLFIYYHMQDPMYFFNLEDMWDDADEVLGPLIDQGNAIRFSVEPYPLILEVGAETAESPAATQYSQLLVFTPEKALNLRAIPIVHQDWPDYGRISVLQVPKGQYVMGPEQADALIDQDPYISSQFALWNRRGLDVIRGHTITVPLDDEVLYIEPVFLRSQQNEVTQLHRVAVVFRERVAMAATFEEALREIYAALGGDEADADAAVVTVSPAVDVNQANTMGH